MTTTHHWLLFFTNKGRVYRAKAHELPEQARTARGQHVAGILAFQPDEHIAQVIDIRDYEAAPYLVLATRNGLVKKTALTDYDSNRSGGIVAINLREDDELIAARLVSRRRRPAARQPQGDVDPLPADDEQLRPMGRQTSGVIGMRFEERRAAGDGGRPREPTICWWRPPAATPSAPSSTSTRVQRRGGKGVLTAKIVSTRGGLVGALVVQPDDELYAITSGAGVLRTVARRRPSRAVVLEDHAAGRPRDVRDPAGDVQPLNGQVGAG